MDMVAPKSNPLHAPPTVARASVSHFHIQSRIRVHASSCSAGCCNSISLCAARASRGLKFNTFGRPEFVSKVLGLPSFAVSNEGGAGGGSGGSDDGKTGDHGGGSSEDGDDGSNWPLLSWYMSLLTKYPIIAKAVTSAFLNLIGDLVCQLMIDKVRSLDMKRTFIFTLLGLVLVGPTLHFWYLYLSQLVINPGAYGAFSRLLLDQEWLSSVVANWQLWIPFQFLNFRFVPQQFQVLAANFIALVWNVILSYKAHKEVLVK